MLKSITTPPIKEGSADFIVREPDITLSSVVNIVIIDIELTVKLEPITNIAGISSCAILPGGGSITIVCFSIDVLNLGALKK